MKQFEFSCSNRKLTNEREGMGFIVRYKTFRYNEWWALGEESELVASEFYDLEKDPGSEVNESDNKIYKSVRKEMSSLIESYRSE